MHLHSGQSLLWVIFGLITCFAVTNVSGDRARRNLFKNAEGAPIWRRPPNSPIISKPMHSTANMDCKARGSPKPSIYWLKNGKPFNNRPMGDIDYRGRYEISLPHLVLQDKGNYTCVVTNKYGSKNMTYHLEVVARGPREPPFIINRMENVTVYESDHANVTWQCKIKSDSTPSISWLKLTLNATKYRATDGWDTYTEFDELKSSTIHVSAEYFTMYNVTQNNTGRYVCYAHNDYGASTAEVWLTVLPGADPSNTPQFFPQKSEPERYRWIIVGVCVLLGIVMVLIFLGVMVFKYRRNKFPNQNPIQMQQNDLYSSTGAWQMEDIKIDEAYEIDRENIQLGNMLGHGAFGCVKKAMAKLPGKNEFTTVAVKMLKDERSDNDFTNLLQEMTILKYTTGQTKHKNVNALLGCCTQNGDLLLVVEYAMYGNLRDFLRERRPSESGYEAPVLESPQEDNMMRQLTFKDLVSFAHQVSRGMEYLASKQIVHRDLAARNVLVAENFVMKIADFGLTRYVKENEEYKSTGIKPMPIKWLAPEALEGKTYTAKSDVWSFGVLCWEIHTLGGNPYNTMGANVSAYDLRNLLKAGTRMERPLYASIEIYKLMLNCWQYFPKKRPQFSEIFQYLDKILSDSMEQQYMQVLPGQSMEGLNYVSDQQHQHMSDQCMYDHYRHYHSNPHPHHHPHPHRYPRHSDSQYSSHSSNGSEHCEHCDRVTSHPCHMSSHDHMSCQVSSQAYRHSMHIDPLEHDRQMPAPNCRCHGDAFRHYTVPRNIGPYQCGTFPRGVHRTHPDRETQHDSSGSKTGVHNDENEMMPLKLSQSTDAFLQSDNLHVTMPARGSTSVRYHPHDIRQNGETQHLVA